MEIREIEFAEIEGVLKLIDQYERPSSPWPTAENREQIFNQLKESGGSVLGAVDNGKIVGTCTVNICPNFSWSGRPYAIIENVIVTKDERNKGIGKALLTAAKDYARSKNCYKVALLTGAKEKFVLQFYESAGFDRSKTGFQVRFNTQSIFNGASR